MQGCNLLYFLTFCLGMRNISLVWVLFNGEMGSTYSVSIDDRWVRSFVTRPSVILRYHEHTQNRKSKYVTMKTTLMLLLVNKTYHCIVYISVENLVLCTIII